MTVWPLKGDAALDQPQPLLGPDQAIEAGSGEDLGLVLQPGAVQEKGAPDPQPVAVAGLDKDAGHDALAPRRRDFGPRCAAGHPIDPLAKRCGVLIEVPQLEGRSAVAGERWSAADAIADLVGQQAEPVLEPLVVE